MTRPLSRAQDPRAWAFRLACGRAIRRKSVDFFEHTLDRLQTGIDCRDLIVEVMELLLVVFLRTNGPGPDVLVLGVRSLRSPRLPDGNHGPRQSGQKRQRKCQRAKRPPHATIHIEAFYSLVCLSVTVTV